MILARKIQKSKDFLQIFGTWKHFLDTCEIPTNFVSVVFLFLFVLSSVSALLTSEQNLVTLLLFLAPFHIFSFLFSSPHFLGDRLSRSCSANRREICKI